MAASESGTLCSTPAFMRAAGTVQTLAARSISTPIGLECLAASRRSEDCELEGLSRHSGIPAQPSHELRQRRIRHRVEVLDLGDLGFGGEEILQVAVPTCGIIAFAEAAGSGPVHHGLDAGAHTARRLGLGRPDRLDHPHDQ